MRRFVTIACVASLAAAIVLISGSSALKQRLHTHGTLHPWLHVLAFAVIGLVAMFCTNKHIVRIALLLGLASLAWGTEYREHLLDGWPIEQSDVQSDLLGIALGGTVGWLVSSRGTSA